MSSDKVVVLSCEHAGNHIPVKYQYLFDEADEALESHRGYDLGAKELYDFVDFNDVVYKQSATASRLLVDVNRSLYRRTLFSEFTNGLTTAQKNEILDDYYYAFRKPFEAKMQALWKRKQTVLHLSVHSFTPELNGEVRKTDFGILYNPERKEEKHFAKLWKEKLNAILPECRVRFNYPFRGKPDGHVRYFRDREEDKYLGIEFEMNQKYAADSIMKRKIAEAFKDAAVEWINT